MNPASSWFCPNCGGSLALVAPASAPRASSQSFFAIPAYLQDAARKRRRRPEPVGGAGWAWVGGILIAVPIVLSNESQVAFAAWGVGLLAVVSGFWMMRRDSSTMAKAGMVTNLVAVVALAAIVARLADSPRYTPASGQLAADATAEATTPPDWEALAAASPTATMAAGTVAMFRGDAEHTGEHPGPGPTGNPKLAWRLDTSGEVYSSPAVGNGMVYIGSKSGFLYAIDGATGEERWQFDLGDYIVRSSPAVTNRMVFIGAGYSLYGIDASSGEEEWRLPIQYAGQSSPTVVGDMVYVSSQEGHVYGVEAQTGTQRWHFQAEGLIFSSPAVVDGSVYVGSDNGSLYAINAQTGKLIWRFEARGEIYSSPSVVDGVVYVSSGSDYTQAVDAKTGKQRWEYGIGGDSSPAVVNGVVYVGSDDGGLYALSTDGAPIWLFATGTPIKSSPVVVAGTVFVASGVNVYAVDAASGTKRWQYATTDTIESSPAVVNGYVYIGSRDGFLYAIGGDGTAE